MRSERICSWTRFVRFRSCPLKLGPDGRTGSLLENKRKHRIEKAFSQQVVLVDDVVRKKYHLATLEGPSLDAEISSG